MRPRPTGASSTVADDSGKGSLVTAWIWDEKQSHGGCGRGRDTQNTLIHECTFNYRHIPILCQQNVSEQVQKRFHFLVLLP